MKWQLHRGYIGTDKYEIYMDLNYDQTVDNMDCDLELLSDH